VQNEPAKLLDVVAMLVDRPQEGLAAGHVGTIVEVFSPEAFEVEFLDPEGRTFAVAELRRNEFLVLKHQPVAA
jgi:hypothetical protein